MLFYITFLFHDTAMSEDRQFFVHYIYLQKLCLHMYLFFFLLKK